MVDVADEILQQHVVMEYPLHLFLDERLRLGTTEEERRRMASTVHHGDHVFDHNTRDHVGGCRPISEKEKKTRKRKKGDVQYGIR